MSLTVRLHRQRDRLTLLACCVVSIALLCLPAGPRFGLARGLAVIAMAPANGTARLGAHLERLRGENEALREQLMQLAQESNRAEEYQREVAHLRRLLEFRSNDSYRFLPAELLSYPLGFHDRNLIRIDRGWNDGVLEGMPVVTPQGLIGAVHVAQESQAEVLLLASKQFAVSCRDMRSRVLGVFKWDPRRGFIVDRVDPIEDVQLGDRFMTSGLGRYFPEGFLLGTVVGVRNPSGGLRKEIRVAPPVPIQSLEDVFVVTAIADSAPGFPLPIAPSAPPAAAEEDAQ
jgi:rod shape-determining protein MreC